MAAVMESVRRTAAIPTYTAVVHSDAEWGGWWVEFPELDIATEGRTPEEVRHNIADCVECYFMDEPDAPEFYNIKVVMG